jgi:hypothetical protein
VFFESKGSGHVVRRARLHGLSALCFALLAISCNAQDRTPTKLPASGSATEIAIAGASVLIGAGDIAMCGSNGDELTAVIVDSLLKVDSAAGVETAVFTMGDNAYPSGAQGARADFTRCFEPSWGSKRIMKVIHPSPGNHDFETTTGAGYYAFFGDKAGPGGLGWYSYDFGKWHVIALNSEILFRRELRFMAREQEEWLTKDLKDHGKPCTMAYWHRPLFSSGTHGDTPEVQRFWDILYKNDVDLVINGHEHHYERFLPQSPLGIPDSVKGIDQIIVGTGGAELRGLRYPLRPNSAMQIIGYHGVLKLTLGDGEYRHSFIDAQGRVWDEGGSKCH